MPDAQGNYTEEELKSMPPEELMELQKKNCVFCRIAKKEIPAANVYDDDFVSCVLDINPASKGHVLIMPKEHFGFLHLTPPDVQKQLFIAAQHVSQAQLKALSVQGTTIFIANGGAAGQRAYHFLFHVIPRDGKDGLFAAAPKELPDAQINELRRALSGGLPRVLKGNLLKPRQQPVRPQVLPAQPAVISAPSPARSPVQSSAPVAPPKEEGKEDETEKGTEEEKGIEENEEEKEEKINADEKKTEGAKAKEDNDEDDAEDNDVDEADNDEEDGQEEPEEKKSAPATPVPVTRRPSQNSDLDAIAKFLIGGK